MSKLPSLFLLAGGACLTVIVFAAAYRARRAAANRQNWQAECEVSECGPDGVPLSLYAG